MKRFKRNTYKMELKCWNCDEWVGVVIPKGTLVEGFQTTCTYCGVIVEATNKESKK